MLTSQSSKPMEDPDYLGVIEGFYGRCWQWDVRQEWAAFMASTGMKTYIYAPKSDRFLRGNWREPWPEDELRSLQRCAAQYQRASVQFGIGLSPVGFGEGSESKDRQRLQRKLEQIATIPGSLLCILFDDVPATGVSMARQQLALYEIIRGSLDPKQTIVCPSYYSTDPVLESLFGPRPKHYWSELGRGLDSDVDFFWTGERVCSEDFSRDNLEFIAEKMCRLPVLWDNYPVNDGKKACRFLNLGPFSGRQPFLARYTAGHIANPMNQSHLSRFPLVTLPLVYRLSSQEDREQVWRNYIVEQMGDHAEQLLEDWQSFLQLGLDDMEALKKQELLARYRSYSDPYSAEIVDWLEEGYAFDPECLT